MHEQSTRSGWMIGVTIAVSPASCSLIRGRQRRRRCESPRVVRRMYGRDEPGPRSRRRNCVTLRPARRPRPASRDSHEEQRESGILRGQDAEQHERRSRGLAAEHQRSAQQGEVEDLDVGLVNPRIDRTARPKGQVSRWCRAPRGHATWNTVSSARLTMVNASFQCSPVRANDGQYGGGDKQLEPEVAEVLAPVSRDEGGGYSQNVSVPYPGNAAIFTSDCVDFRLGHAGRPEGRSTAAPWLCTACPSPTLTRRRLGRPSKVGPPTKRRSADLGRAGLCGWLEHD